MRNVVKCCLLLCAFVSAGLDVADSVPRTKIQEDGITAVRSSFETTIVEVRVTTQREDNGSPAHPMKPKDSACTMSRFPCSLVKGIEIRINKTRVPVPHSAFADLADLTEAEVIASQETYTLVLEGGDASESYKVRIEFNARGVLRREVFAGEFPDKPIQETIYHFQDMD